MTCAKMKGIVKVRLLSNSKIFQYLLLPRALSLFDPGTEEKIALFVCDTDTENLVLSPCELIHDSR